MSPARVVRLAVVPRVLADAIAVEPGEHGGEEEEDAVHDAEGEAGLEHGARLVGVDVDAVAVEGPEYPEVDVVGRPADAGAVRAGDEAEVVDRCDEGADESFYEERCGLVDCANVAGQTMRTLCALWKEAFVPRSIMATKSALELLLW